MESGAREKFSNRTAQLVSVLGHPFVVLPLVVIIAALQNSSAERALTLGLITIVATVLPLLFIIRRKVRAGKWSDHDVSEHSERGSFYRVAVVVIAISVLTFWLFDFPRSLVLGILIGLLLLLAAMFINRWTKISLHLAFAAYSAVALTAVNFWLGAVFMVLVVPAIGWSRIKLKRHSLGQVLAGAMLGAAAGIMLIWTLGFISAAVVGK